MKKSKTILFSLLTCCFLFSCAKTNSNDSNSSASTPVYTLNDDLFEELKEGYKAQVQVTEVIDGIENQYLIQTAAKEKEFSFIQYQDLTSNEVVLHETYLGRRVDNYVYATRLNISNTLNYYKVYNPVTYEYFTWEDGFENVFSFLSKKDFIPEDYDPNLYLLSSSKLNIARVNHALSSLFYGNPGLEIVELSLTLKDDSIQLSAFTDPITVSKTYEYEFSATFTQMGDEVTIDYLATPYEEVQDEAFKTMIATLKADNYIATARNYVENIEVSNSIFRSNADKISYDIYDDEEGNIFAGAYALNENLVQDVIQVDGQYYKSESPYVGNVPHPSFNISRACFDKIDDHTYKIKSNVEGDFTVYYILEALTYTIANLTIEILDDQYIFTNISGNNKTVVTFSSFGTADVGYTIDTVLENA